MSEHVVGQKYDIDEYGAHPHSDGDWVKAEDYLALQTELDDIKETYKNTVEGKCAGDEKHCSCVPALRAEIERLKTALQKIRAAGPKNYEPNCEHWDWGNCDDSYQYGRDTGRNEAAMIASIALDGKEPQ